MKMSDNINELAAALSDAQSQMEGAVKDATNPFFKSKYADLESVWACIRKPLADNGLAVSQMTTFENGGCTIDTVIMHSSGQWIRGSYPVLAKDNSPQAMGSAVSYGRRYSLAAALGVYQTDDDGNHAQPQKTTNAPKPEAPKDPVASHPLTPQIAKAAATLDKILIQSAEQKRSDELSRDPNFKRMAVDSAITEPQRKRLWAICNEKGWSEVALKSYLKNTHKLTSSKDITYGIYDDVVNHVRRNPGVGTNVNKTTGAK